MNYVRNAAKHQRLRSCFSARTPFCVESAAHLSAAVGRVRSGGGEGGGGKDNQKTIGGLWFSYAPVFVSCLNLQRVCVVIRMESSKW